MFKEGDEFACTQGSIRSKQEKEFEALCCVQTVYKWMRGESIPSIDILYSLCALLRVNMDSLLVGNKEQVVLENMNRGL